MHSGGSGIERNLLITLPSEDVYQKLRAQLAARIRCKDPDVRAQAVMAISRLQDSGNFHGNKDVMNNILDAMQKDPNP